MLRLVPVSPMPAAAAAPCSHHLFSPSFSLLSPSPHINSSTSQEQSHHSYTTLQHSTHWESESTAGFLFLLYDSVESATEITLNYTAKEREKNPHRWWIYTCLTYTSTRVTFNWLYLSYLFVCPSYLSVSPIHLSVCHLFICPFYLSVSPIHPSCPPYLFVYSTVQSTFLSVHSICPICLSYLLVRPFYLSVCCISRSVCPSYPPVFHISQFVCLLVLFYIIVQ